MGSKIDARQVISRDTLTQIAAAASNKEVDDLLRSIDSEASMPLRMLPTSTPDRTVNIQSITLTNPETSRNRTIPTISNLLPAFASGTVTLPASAGGSITVSPGVGSTLTMSANSYLKIGINLDSAGNIQLTFGTEGASLSAATAPASYANAFAIGFIVARTNGSSQVQNIINSDIYQYVGGGGGGGAGGILTADLFDNTRTTLPTAATGYPGLLVDGNVLQSGDTVLFTNLSSNNNKIYEATVTESVTWTEYSAAEANQYMAIAWSKELNLFAAVAGTGTNRVMTSPDGFSWTARAAAQANSWLSVIWAPEISLFVSTSVDGTNRVMTSPDGITWTAQTAAEANQWRKLAWSPDLGLLAAVSADGTNRVMTSPNGITWTARAASSVSVWTDIVWAQRLGLFVAVAQSTTNHIMTSPDGINWTTRLTPSSTAYAAITWSQELGILVAISSNDKIMYSYDAINWTEINTPSSGAWISLAWSRENGYFIATATTGTNRVMTSPDGITWTARTTPNQYEWNGITWSPELGIFAAVSKTGTNRVMTSPGAAFAISWTNTNLITGTPDDGFSVRALRGSPSLKVLTFDGSNFKEKEETNGYYEDIKNQLVDSPYELVTPSILGVSGRSRLSYVHRSDYKPVIGSAQFTSKHQKVYSSNLIDAESFGSTGLDVTSVDVSAFWGNGSGDESADIPENAIYEISRDGGKNFYPIIMSRAGKTGAFHGSLEFDNTEVKSVLTANVGEQLNTRTLSINGGLWADSGSSPVFGGTAIRSLAYGAGKYILTGSSGQIAYSNDGDGWTTATSSPIFGSTNVNASAYGSGKFVVGGFSGQVSYSTDGNTWTTATSSPIFGGSTVLEMTYGNGRFVAGGSSGKVAYSTDGNTWTTAASSPIMGSNDVTGLVYGNGKFVAVGFNGTIAYSTDGNTWTTAASSPIFSSPFSVTYGNGKFVAVGQSGQVSCSTDGNTWTTAVSSPILGSLNVNAVSYGDGEFIAVGSSGTIAHSTDGNTWTTAASSPIMGGTTAQALVYGSGRFVAAGNSGKIAYSYNSKRISQPITVPNGEIWVLQSIKPSLVKTGSPTGKIYCSIIKDSGGFPSSYGPDIVTQSSAIDVSTLTSGLNEIAIPSSILLPGKYHAVFSTDSQYKTNAATAYISINRKLSNGQPIDAFGGNSEWFSTSGTVLIMHTTGRKIDLRMSVSAGGMGDIWQNTISSPIFGGSQINGAAYGNGKYVAVGTSGKIAHSTDGNTWTTAASSPIFGSLDITGVTYGNGRFVAVGLSGQASYSTDGNTWTTAASSLLDGSQVYGITYGNNKFIAVGNSGKVAYSTDGNTWTTAASSPIMGGGYALSTAYGNGKYVAVGLAGRIAYSTDGNTWATATSSPIFGGLSDVRGVAYGNSRFVAVGDGGKISYSTDGNTWTTAASSPIFGGGSIRGITYGNNKFVAVGDGGKISYSTDGNTWTTAASSPIMGGAYAINGVAYGNSKFIAVGSGGRVALLEDNTYSLLSLDGFAVYYNRQDNGIVGSTRKNQRFSFNSVSDNLSSFVITSFTPDPDLLTCYYVQGGQAFKVPSFVLSGNTAIFPANTFNNGGVSALVTLIFDQNTGGSYDNSDNNARLLAANHLGSTDGNLDRSAAGRGVFLRRPDGTLREICLDDSDNIVVYSV